MRELKRIAVTLLVAGLIYAWIWTMLAFGRVLLP